ncbi:MAG: N-6 DNA methylase [Armatimonadetes bacterium]|nr:N-6 DNA methylase [Armatimonadota bacterium]
MTHYKEKLPAAGPEREALRQKGQFWTPAWVAEAMAAYALGGGAGELFDPAVGEGAFFRAARAIEAETGRQVTLSGREVDPEALAGASRNGLPESDLSRVELADFVLQPPDRKFQAIAANPPYIRHHRLPAEVKARLKALGANLTGRMLDGRAGLHLYFLVRALALLEEGGRLAFIVPADTCEGVFAPSLWDWIARRFHLDAVVTFTPEASPFPGVDINAVILMIRNSRPENRFLWVRCLRPQTPALKAWALSGFQDAGEGHLDIHKRSTDEALSTGLSRPPTQTCPDGPVLGDYVRILRGIATGANEFFFLTVRQAEERGIPGEYLARAIGRTRDLSGDEVTAGDLHALDAAGRPTRLLNLKGIPADRLPAPVQTYLRLGEAEGIPQRALISTRKPWYKMETRPVPPFLFAYLGCRSARFVRNRAGVLPLTGFLCVYPLCQDEDYLERLWQVLCHPQTAANLARVGKSYGSGAIKVEPRALERLPLPEPILKEVGL